MRGAEPARACPLCARAMEWWTCEPPQWAGWCRRCRWAGTGRTDEPADGAATRAGEADWPWEGARLLARARCPQIAWRPVRAPCHRCGQEARVRAVRTTDQQAWEADLCRACGFLVVTRRLLTPSPARIDVGQQWVPPDRGVLWFARLFLWRRRAPA